MKYRNLLLKGLFFAVMICSSFNVFSQNKNHEIGIRLSSFQDFDFIYKKEIAENKLTRYRFALLSYQLSHSSNNNKYTFSIGFAIGRENRKKINEQLYFIHGLEPEINLQYLTRTNNSSTSVHIQAALGYVLGFQYNFSKAFYVNLESIPSLAGFFKIDEDGFDEDYNLFLGFNSNAIALSLVYKFSTQ